MRSLIKVFGFERELKMARKMIVKPGEVKSVELNASFTNVNENGTEPDPWDIPRDGGENEAPPPAPVQAEPPRRIRRAALTRSSRAT